MRRAVRAGLAMAFVAGWPLAGHAQDAVIRIEAKRGAEAAAEAAANWGRQFDDVVTFPMARGWFGIALGPLDPAEANARLAELKAANAIPADSFVSVPEGVELTPLAADAQSDTSDGADTGGSGKASLAAGAAAGEGGGSLLSGDDIVIDGRAEDQPGSVEETVTGQGPGGAVAEPEPEPEAEPEPDPQPSAPGTHIRLQTLAGQAEAESALAEWRQTFPEASLWRIPGGRFAIALGPLEDATAHAWLAAFREAGQVPRDAFTSDAAEMGEALDTGPDLALPAPGETQEMPPLEDIQRALRWAGHYDGAIDGKTGPQTRAAIAAEVANLRLSPDAGTAMRLLIERRAEWRKEMGLTELRDDYTGLSVIAPLDVLEFNRNERSLAIYGPKNDSGAALILFSQPGGQQELLDMTGLVTALGWVPQPERNISQGHALLEGQNADHIGHAEGWVRDGRAEGFVLIWAASAAEDQARVAAELSDSLSRFAPAQNDAQATAPASPADDTTQP